VSWVQVYTGRNDYYAGDHSILYKDGTLVWEGYAGGEISEVLDLVIGKDREVRHVRIEYGDMPERLEFLDFYDEEDEDFGFEYTGTAVNIGDLTGPLQWYRDTVKEQLNARSLLFYQLPGKMSE